MIAWFVVNVCVFAIGFAAGGALAMWRNDHR